MIRIVEVGPRDGLQNESRVLAPSTRIELVRRLAASGLREIEVGSMVRDDLLPQLAETDAVLIGLQDVPLTRSIVLVPNSRGLDRAMEAGAPVVAVFVAASDTFNRRNIGRDTATAMADFAVVARDALTAGVPVRGYVSTVFGCPFEGSVSPEQVLRLVDAMFEMGCYEVSLGDTIGVGTPEQTRELVTALSRTVGVDRISVHMHDTHGRGLANTLTAIDLGVPAADTSVGGLGGCPFAGEGATGNLATEALVSALIERGEAGSIDFDALLDTADWVQRELGLVPR